jgi:putative tryptophan/tyrosine transport system substrate-binding protein
MSIVALAASCLLFTLCAAVEAQQSVIKPHIGYLSSAGDANNPGPNIESFRRGLLGLGYDEGKNIVVEYRYFQGKRERIPTL